MLKEYNVEVCAVVATSMEPKPELEGAEADLDDTRVRLNNSAVLKSKLGYNEVSELQHLLLDNIQLF